MPVHLVNPNDNSFGIGIIVPRWLYVLAAATPERFGVPSVVDETLDPLDLASVSPGDVVGIGIHTLNALRGTRWAASRRSGERMSSTEAFTPPCIPRNRSSRAPPPRWCGAMETSSGAQVLEDAARGTSPARIRRRANRRRPVLSREVGPSSRGSLHAGLGADGARLSQALLVLLRVAHRRPKAAAALLGRHHGRSGPASQDGFSFHSSRRRQLLSGDQARPRARGEARTTRRPARGADRHPRRALRADGPALEASPRHGLPHADHHGGGGRSRSTCRR